jgi:hypothetical protein
VVLSTATSARQQGEREGVDEPEAQRAVDLKAVRAWTTSNGIQVSSRGRLPASVLEQYRSAGN